MTTSAVDSAFTMAHKASTSMGRPARSAATQELAPGTRYNPSVPTSKAVLTIRIQWVSAARVCVATVVDRFAKEAFRVQIARTLPRFVVVARGHGDHGNRVALRLEGGLFLREPGQAGGGVGLSALP